MLHGVGGHAEAFARNVVPLSRTFNARAIDYYGHGLTGFGDQDFSKDAYVKHLIDFMDAAGIERAHLIGESLGGWIAVWTAIHYPDRVGKIVYTVGAHLNVPIDAATRAKTDTGTAELKRLSLQFVNAPSRENVHARLRWLFHKPERDISEELIDLRWALYQRSLDNPSPTAQIGAPNTSSPRGTCSSPKTDVISLDGSQSVATSGDGEKGHDYVPDAEWALIEDAGHWPQWEHPELFNRIVTDYLTR